MESNGRHGLACKKQIGRRSRHDEVNKLIKRAIVQAKIPAVLEPSNLSREDGKRPDGLTYLRGNPENVSFGTILVPILCVLPM